MTDRSPFPDIEAALVDLFADLAGTGTVTPANLQDAMPFIRIQRFGGEDDGFTDASLVAIDAFSAVRADAYALAESIRQRLLANLPNIVDGITIDNATTATGPNEVQWSDDQTVRRFAASYRVTARR